jgi:hypothetical protein
MPVPYFLLFLCFRKAIWEIFSELDETKAKSPKILPKHLESRRGVGVGPRGALTPGRRGQGLGRAPYV